MQITTPPPQKICPSCSAKQSDHHRRCVHDGSYLVTQEAYLSARNDKMLGQELGGRYGVIERLGMGGMGAVYKAVSAQGDQEVAVKVLREAYAEHPAIRERFIREAEAGASLDHPNVVPLVDFGIEDDGRLWLAMEFVKGWTLRDEINHNGAFSVSAAIELMRQVLSGLAVAHDAGMIHRDLKHDNIMYYGRRERFTARIVDFGVVKSAAADLDRHRSRHAKPQGRGRSNQKRALGQDQDGAFDLSAEVGSLVDTASPAAIEQGGLEAKALTAVGMMVGSPSYMAPEQIRGLSVGPPADLYALAVVVYEVLAARRLFTVNDYETLLREDAQREAPQLVFSARGELIPEAFSEIIHTALAHDPTDRYQDAHTMLLALDQMPRHESVIPPDLFCNLVSADAANVAIDDTLDGLGDKPSQGDKREVGNLNEQPTSDAAAQQGSSSAQLSIESPMLFEGEVLSNTPRAGHKAGAPSAGDLRVSASHADIDAEYLDSLEGEEERERASARQSHRLTLGEVILWLTPLLVGVSAWLSVWCARQ